MHCGKNELPLICSVNGKCIWEKYVSTRVRCCIQPLYLNNFNDDTHIYSHDGDIAFEHRMSQSKHIRIVNTSSTPQLVLYSICMRLSQTYCLLNVVCGI